MNKDDYIKNKIQCDKYLPSKVDDVFKNFRLNNSNHVSNVIEFNINKNSDVNKDEQLYESSQQNENTKKQSAFFVYKRINKLLSAVAVFLCVVLVGVGSLLKNRPSEIENIDIITKNILVKNTEYSFSNEDVRETSENNLVRALVIGKRQVVIQLKEEFISEYNLDLQSNKYYNVDNINKDIKDVFVGCMISNKTPYVMLVMEDGTAECIQIFNDEIKPDENYEFNFYSQGEIYGLYDVVGFEQCSRKYTNKEGYFYYINAIRNDGKKKEIELGFYNNWDSDYSYIYDSLDVLE
ncbi:MAG: hypothetical protein E7313_04095 [Clostridiales bacterium]|nr:hypothetical protein [Clostridiales bacterium]